MNNRNGIFLMITAMAGFTLEDLFIKKLSSTISIGQILMVLGVFSALFFAGFAKVKGHSLTASKAWTKATLSRVVAEAIAAVSFVTSLSLVPISTVAAVFQATPLVITMGAALFLGDKVGWRRWMAISVGFIGVLFIVRPGFNSFDPGVIWVLISVIGVAIRDLLTRIIPNNVASSVISFQAYSALIIAGAVILIINTQTIVPVTNIEFIYFACGIVFGIIGYYGLVLSMRVGETSIVSPFRYTRLIFSLLVGIIVFDENPDGFTLFGSAIIIFTGLYIFIREQHLSKENL